MCAVVLGALGVIAARGISAERAARARLKQSIELTLAIHAPGGIALCIAILAHRFDS